MQSNLITWSKEYETVSLNKFAMRCYKMITIALLWIQIYEVVARNEHRLFLLSCAVVVSFLLALNF